MRSKAQLRRELEKGRNTYTAEELFSSPYMSEMLMATIESVCKKLGRVPCLKASYDLSDESVAYTDGSMIFINTAAKTVRSLGSDWEKYVCLIGHAVHECGHVLFTDFYDQNKMHSCWMDGSELFNTGLPDVEGAEKVSDFMLSHPGYRSIYATAMHNVVNAIEDAYIEQRLFMYFGGLAAAGLTIGNRCLENAVDIKDMAKGIISGMPPVFMASNYVLMKYKLRMDICTCSLSGAEKKAFDDFASAMDTCDSEFNSLVSEENGVRRCILLNRIYVKLFSLLKINENEEDGETVGPDGENENSSIPDISRDKEDEMEKSIGNSSLENITGMAPFGNTKPVDAGDDGNAGNENRETGSSLASCKESMERELKKALSNASYMKVMADDEREHEKILKDEALDMYYSYSGAHVFFSGYSLSRPLPDRNRYNRLSGELCKTSSALYRKIDGILKCRKPGSMDRGYLIGQKFNAMDLANHNGKYFSRQILPDGTPSVAFGILIDESGSMEGTKCETARNSALILEDALRRLGTPLCIAGHTTSYDDDGISEIHMFCDFDTFDGNDRYRLANIGSFNCNIDGAAITYMSEKLLRREESRKVLIVISDGFPTGSSFYDSDCIKDTKTAIEKYRKKDISIFGAVVDEYENIKGIYGEKYAFDCHTGSSLISEMSKIVKRYILD